MNGKVILVAAAVVLCVYYVCEAHPADLLKPCKISHRRALTCRVCSKEMAECCRNQKAMHYCAEELAKRLRRPHLRKRNWVNELFGGHISAASEDLSSSSSSHSNEDEHKRSFGGLNNW